MGSCDFSWKLADHPKLPKGKTVAVVVLDGWGEASADQFNCIHVAETPTMDSLKQLCLIDEISRVVEVVRRSQEAGSSGIVLRRREYIRIMFDRRFESEGGLLFVRLKALNGEEAVGAELRVQLWGFYSDPEALEGYLKICKEVKERRLQLFKDYFGEERKKLESTKVTDKAGLKCTVGRFFFFSYVVDK